ncbi:MAG: 1-phosphofructokinase family hexose kinase [Thermus sp.]|uniref:1-phosphofructokinase family hexose kinase n=1 Tax=Thermus sp. TaxID=275 RepID=UPI00391DA58F
MIVAFTPCPCLDRVLLLPGLTPRALHRPLGVVERAGGKGLNLVRAVVRLGGKGVALAPLGGWSGAEVRRLARREGLPLAAWRGGRTRLCHILLAPEGPTEVYEPCPPLGLRGLAHMARLAPEGTRVLSGSLPPGLAPEEALRVLKPFAVDSSPAFPAALRLGGGAGVGLIKPNRQELAGLHPGAPQEAAEALHRASGVRVLASLGEEGAVYAGPEGVWWARGPRREGNPVGSGDTLLGAFLLGLEEGWPLGEALAFAVAAATANVGRGGGEVALAEVRELLPSVEVGRGLPGRG